MKTKAILLAGILLATGIANSSAQVYSVNAVGYVTVTLAPGEFKIVGNPLNVVTNGTQNNTLNAILPNAPNDVTRIYRYNATTFAYSLITKRSSGWSPGGSTTTINPGEGFFLNNNGTTNITVTFVGEVPQGTDMTISLVNGFNLIAPHVPVGGLLETDLGLPVQSASTAQPELVYLYRSGSYVLFTRRTSWAGNNQPSVGVAEGFYYKPNQVKSWVKTFTTSI
ncbi:MAG: hypothetical protein HZA89_06975 [Verrucomicrobia bacterium]|nr:hypothetical protein [Verrucomicrobiota bacterium]